MLIDDAKKLLRSRLRSARAAITSAQQTALSGRIVDRFGSLPKMMEADSVAFYVSIRHEVRTESAILGCVAGSGAGRRQRISVPVVVGDDLQLFEIRSINELRPGTFGVPEPTQTIQQTAERQVAPSSVDLIVVPGLGFDEHGGRIGYGRGFYDRLLKAAPNAASVALAYECQVVKEVPMSADDVRVQFVVTESRVIECCANGDRQDP